MTIAKKEQMLHAVITSIRQTGFAQLKMDDFIRIMPLAVPQFTGILPHGRPCWLR